MGWFDKLLPFRYKKMHKLGFVHGDMKASNTGIYLDEKGTIIKAHLLDTQKVRQLSKSSSEYKEAADDDIKTFWNHVRKNKKER